MERPIPLEGRRMRRGVFRIFFLAAAVLVVCVSCAGTSKKENEAQAHYKIGVSHLASGNIQAAFLKFQEALKLDPDNKEIHNALGNVYLRLEEYGNAEEQFETSLRIDRHYSEAYNNLCYVHYMTGRFKEAIESCGKALENPLYATPEKAFYNLGRAHYRLGNFAEAAAAFTNAAKRYPNFFPAFYGLALAYNASRMYGEAASAMGDAIGFDPRFLGDRVKAEKEFRKQMADALDTREHKDLKDYIEILHY